MSNKTPKIEPILTREFEVKQSKYDVAGKLPIRSVILGPSVSGKTIRLQHTILDTHRDCFKDLRLFPFD